MATPGPRPYSDADAQALRVTGLHKICRDLTETVRIAEAHLQVLQELKREADALYAAALHEEES
jgi:hypothetical protein